MCAITKKVLRYEAGYNDRGLDISTFTYGVGTSHVCAMEYTKVDLAILACVLLISRSLVASELASNLSL
jgi:hypothetical protein